MAGNKSMHCIAVIGGGAAGFFCAVNAARRNPDVEIIILEKTNKLLSKVKVSGGGRCNVTHACFDITEMTRRYPRGANFVKKTFHQFFTTDTIEWFKSRGVELKAEPDGRMFPVTDNSETIIRCLLDEAASAGVQIHMNAEVSAITSHHPGFSIHLTDGRMIKADKVCITTGGYPKVNQFHWIEQLGHKIETPVPSLFTFNLPGHPITQLMGISVSDVVVKIHGTKLVQRGPVLITHWGLSGPAVLKLSAFAARELQKKDYHFPVQINWVPEYNEEQARKELQGMREVQGSGLMSGRNPFSLSNRLWQWLLEQSGITSVVRWSELQSKQLHVLVTLITAQVFEVKGKTTFKEEFVTAGGVSLSEIDANTMQSKIVPGLYFAGEVMDVDGITGGYNFQHAWTSGWIAAKAMVDALHGT